jgi:hypothetical protein
MVDLGSPLEPLHSPRARDKPLHDEARENDWIFSLPLTLEELYGCAYQRYRISRKLRSGQTQSVKVDVKVSPNWHDGTRIRLPGIGNERDDGTFQDIVFVVEQEPHDAFTRVGHDLYVSLQVPWRESCPRPYASSSSVSSDSTEDDDLWFGDESVYVRALDGKEYALPIPRSLVEAADGTHVRGMGMPIRKHGKIVGHGDLIVKCVASSRLLSGSGLTVTLSPTDGSLPFPNQKRDDGPGGKT